MNMQADLMKAVNKFLNFDWSDINKIMADSGLVVKENRLIEITYSMPDNDRIPDEVYSRIYSATRQLVEPFGIGRYRNATEIRCSNSVIFNSEQTWHGIRVALVNGICNITGNSGLCLLFGGEDESIIISLGVLKELIDLLDSENR